MEVEELSLEAEPLTMPGSESVSLATLALQRLPSEIYTFLRHVGDLADELNVGVYVVGGFVRDLILGKENDDIDLVVEENGIAFADILAQKYGIPEKTVRHHQFHTATVVLKDGLKIDIATARLEHYPKYGSLPVVETSTLQMDLFRRDFTINAMAMRLNKANFGELFDIYSGSKDIEQGRLAVLHPQSFLDDPTRIFRAVRFEQRYKFQIDPEHLSLMNNALCIDVLKEITGTRLFNEFDKIFAEENPYHVMRRLHEIDMLEHCFPNFDVHIIKIVDEIIKRYRDILKTTAENFKHWKFYYLAISHNFTCSPRRKEEFTAMCERYLFVGGIMTELENVYQSWKRAKKTLSLEHSRSEVYNILRYVSLEGIFLLIVLMEVAATTEAEHNRVHEFWRIYLTEIRYMKISIDGNDLKKLGLRPGPQFKAILEDVMAATLDGKVGVDKAAQLQYVKEKLKSVHYIQG